MVRGETDKTASDIQARWPQLWRGVGRNAEQSSIMLEDYEEFLSLTLRTRSSKKPSGMLERKWETSMAPATPRKTCKKSKNGETRSKTNDLKSKFACILEASESTRLRMEESLPNYHEDHIAGEEATHCNITIWYTHIILCFKQ